MSEIVQQFERCLALTFFDLEWKLTFSSPVATAEFPRFAGILSSKWTELKVSQLCLTLCDPMNYTVQGILQARILEWVAIPFFRGSSQLRDEAQVSWIAGRFFTTWATKEAQVCPHLNYTCKDQIPK